MLKVVLVGRIGSGKSTVMQILQQYGVPALDLDAVGRALQQEPEVVQRLVEVLGDTMANHGVLNRSRLAAICFADRDNRARLEAVMHPLIWQQARCWWDKQQAPYVIIEASALLHTPVDIDCVVTVDAPQDSRRQRVVARGKQSGERFDRIDCWQQPPDGDFSIDNSGSQQVLQRRVQQLHGQLLALSEQSLLSGARDDHGSSYTIEQ